MSNHDRNATASDVDAMLQRHIHVKSFAKMDQGQGHQGHQSQGHQGHGHGDHGGHGGQHQQPKQDPECESPKIKRKIGNEELTSHRLIEKRRRDRMNSCLADLSRLIPSSYIKKGRGRVEKTEIVQMAIKYIRQLQQGGGSCGGGDGRSQKESVRYDASIQTPDTCPDQDQLNKELFVLGYNECFEETIQFLVERESMDPGRIVLHLRNHFDDVAIKKVGKLTSTSIKTPRRRFGTTTSDSDYTSLQSDTSSDWSQTSKATSMMTATSSTSGLTSFSSCDDMDEILCRSKDQRSDKRCFKTTEDLRSQYKFKADMRDRFRFHQQDNMFWQPSSGNDNDDNNRMNNKQEWTNWPQASSVWPIKRKKYSSPYEDVRDTRAMPPPPSSSEHESQSSDNMSETIWPKLTGRSGFMSSGQHQQMTPDIIECDSGPPPSHHHNNHHHHHHQQQQQLQQRRGSMDRDSNPGQGVNPLGHPLNSQLAQDLSSSNLLCSLKHKSVPIFALHPLGSYYIPLVVNYGLLAPFVTFLEDPKMPDGLTLHPVTISVNFCTKPVIQMPPLTSISTAQKTTTSEKSSNSYNVGDDEKSKNSAPQFESRSRPIRSEHRCSI